MNNNDELNKEKSKLFKIDQSQLCNRKNMLNINNDSINNQDNDNFQSGIDQDITDTYGEESSYSLNSSYHNIQNQNKYSSIKYTACPSGNILEYSKAYIHEDIDTYQHAFNNNKNISNYTQNNPLQNNINYHNNNGVIITRTVVEKSPKGRFQRFNEHLGSGSQKTVYLAFDYDNGREVAWNIINVNLKDELSVDGIKEEIEILKKLKHPNIIKFIYGFYNQEKKQIVVITELYSGGSLKHYLNINKSPRLRAIKLWSTEILKGLKYLHEFNPPIIHRDIKCDNILINRVTGEVRIGDLGLCCTLKPGEEYFNTFSGTPEFCSPEVYKGKYGIKTDIYSFGMCLLEMCTLEKPYNECEGNIINICNKVTNHIKPLSLTKIKNKRLFDFINCCLVDEEVRPSADDLLKMDFLNDLDHEENNYNPLDYPVNANIYNKDNTTCKNCDFNKNAKKHNNEINDNVHSNINTNFTSYTNTKSSNKKLTDKKMNPKIKNNSNSCNLKNIKSIFKNLNCNFSNIILLKKQNSHSNITSYLLQSKYNLHDEINSITNTKKKTSNKLIKNNKKLNEDNIKIYLNEEEENKNDKIIKVILEKKVNNKSSNEKNLKIKFDINLDDDTIEGVVNELTKVIDLNENEQKEILTNLTILLNKFRQNLIYQKEVGQKDDIKNLYNDFISNYNSYLKDISQLLDEYKNIKNDDLENKQIQDYNNKIKLLNNFVNNIE